VRERYDSADILCTEEDGYRLLLFSTEQAICLPAGLVVRTVLVISNDWARSETPRLGAVMSAQPSSVAGIYKRKFPVSARVVSK